MEKTKNIPELRFPEFKGEWEKKRLVDISKIERGRFSPRPRNNPIYYNGNIPFVQTSDVVNSNGVIFNYTQTLNERGLSVSKLFPKGTILITIAANIGYTGVLSLDMACPDSLIGITCNEGYNNLFLNIRFSLEQPKFDYLAVAAAQKNINIEFLKPYKFSFPSLPEQQKIASFLTAVDEKLTALKKKKELLEEYKKGVMQGIFCQNQKSLNHDSPDYLDGQDVKSGKSSPSQKSRFRQLRFKDDNGKEFPKWNYKHGNEIFESISDKNHNSDLPILAITQEHGAIPRDLIDYNISVTEASIESYKVVQKGDFIISLRSFQGGIEYSEYKGICSPAYIILRSKITIDDRFFKSYLKTESYIKELNKKLEGIRDGKMISYKYFSEVKLPYPCIEEQTKIANFLSVIDKKIDQCQQQIEQTTQWKKGLLQKMFV